jgi:hypothetical protein
MPAKYDSEIKDKLKNLIKQHVLMIGKDSFVEDNVLASIAKQEDVTTDILYRMISSKNLNIKRFCYLDDLDANTPTKISIVSNCSLCGCCYAMLVIKFLGRTYKNNNLCQTHYVSSVCKTDTWKRKNSDAQKIAQNKQETKEKQSLSQKRRFSNEEIREHYRRNTKAMWENIDYRRKVSNGNRQKWEDADYVERVTSKSHGAYRSTYQGYYEGLRYQSLAELSFILWAKDNKHKIVRFNLPGIPWEDENQIERLYFPDYIINDTTIIEVKSGHKCYGLDPNNVKTTQEKYNALVRFCSDTHYSPRLVFLADLNDRNIIKRAKSIHEQNCLKKVSPHDGNCP